MLARLIVEIILMAIRLVINNEMCVRVVFEPVRKVPQYMGSEVV